MRIVRFLARARCFYFRSFPRKRESCFLCTDKPVPAFRLRAPGFGGLQTRRSSYNERRRVAETSGFWSRLNLSHPAPGLLRRPARHQKVAGEDLHRLVVLVVSGVTHPDHAAVGPRFRRPHVEYFAVHMQLVAGTNRARPAQFVKADAENAAGRLEFAVDQKPHGDRGGVPAARRQSGKRRRFRRLLVEMIGLRIVFLGKGEDLVFVDPLAPGLEHLPDGKIFEIAFGHASSSRATRSGLSNHEPPAIAPALLTPNAQSATAKAANTPARLPVKRSAK